MHNGPQKYRDKLWRTPIYTNRYLAPVTTEEIELKGSQKLKTIELEVDLTATDFAEIELEKSYKEMDYTTIAMLSGQAQVRNKLSFIDNYPVIGYQFYRLKCTKNDRSSIYSIVAPVLFTNNTPVLSLFTPL